LRDYQDIRTITKSLEGIAAELREIEYSMDETIEKVGQAIQMYKNFKFHFSEKKLSVEVVQKNADGQFILVPFDWRALDTLGAH